MKRYFLFSILISALTSVPLQAQVAVSASANPTPHASAMLDVQSNAKGFLTPRMTSSQRTNINSPAIGLLVFDTTTDSFWFYNGTLWDELITETESIISDAAKQTKIQVEEVANDGRIRFDLDGSEKMILDYSSSPSQGPVLQMMNSDKNTLVGRLSGQNTAGTFNSYLGAFAGNKNTTGNNNTYLGLSSGENNLNGSGNTMVGYKAGRVQTSGNQNVYLGHNAGQNKTGGDKNVMIGHAAGSQSGAGSGNVFIGYQAGLSATGDNNLYISNSATNDPLIKGNFSSKTLHINGQLISNKLFTAGNWISGDGDNEGIFINNNNKIGIGMVPGKELSVNGKVLINGGMKLGSHGDYRAVLYDRKITMATITVQADGTYGGGQWAVSDFIQSVNKTAVGSYTINFVNGTFSDAPIAVVTSHIGSETDLYGHIVSIGTNAVSIEIHNDNGFKRDGRFCVLFIGEHN